MSYIISIRYLLHLLVFIYIIHTCDTIETQIKIVFMNGLNVVRCSDNQIQVYRLTDSTDKVISTTVTCARKNEIYYNKYIGFTWNQLELICTSENSKVHEKQTITRVIPGDIEFISNVKGQLDQSEESYKLQINHESSVATGTIVSDEQEADSTYFNENTTPKERRIYLWFPDHPIICRLIFNSKEDSPCPSMHENPIDDANYACYYNPGAESLPTIEMMEAELKLVEEAEFEPDNAEAYVLDLSRPDSVSTDASEAADASDSSEHEDENSVSTYSSKHSTIKTFIFSKKSSNRTKSASFKKKLLPSNSSDSNKNSNIIQLIGILFGIILLIGILGIIIYYVIRKYHFKNTTTTSSSSVKIEDGSRGSNSVAPNQSQQSLAVRSTQDTNAEVSANVPTKQIRFVKQQAPEGNIRQRTDTRMMFDEDM